MWQGKQSIKNIKSSDEPVTFSFCLAANYTRCLGNRFFQERPVDLPSDISCSNCLEALILIPKLLCHNTSSFFPKWGTSIALIVVFGHQNINIYNDNVLSFSRKYLLRKCQWNLTFDSYLSELCAHGLWGKGIRLYSFKWTVKKDPLCVVVIVKDNIVEAG